MTDQLRRLGPGFVYALTILGTGDLVSNAAAGAGYGYALIWTVALTLVFRFAWINASAKYVLVTGESLLEGYARVGRWVLWIVFLGVLVLGHINTMTQIVMTGRAADLLVHLPTRWSAALWSLLFTAIAFSMAFWGGYRLVEGFCKVLVGFMAFSLVVVAVLSRPDPAQIVTGTLIPTIPGSQGLYSALFVMMAVIGTGAGSTTNLTYAYFIHQKGWRDLSYLKQQRRDLIFGVLCMFAMGSLLQIAAAATIHPLGVDLEDADDLVRIFSEVQGMVGWIIFSLGLWGAAFSTLVGVSVGYALVLTDVSGLLVKPFRRRGAENARLHPVYRFCVLFWCFSPLYILFTEVRPVWLILLVNSIVVLMIPVLTPVLLRITNDRRLMGEHRNGWLTNLILVFLVAVAVYLTWRNLSDTWC